ncbi:hypothetical protein [Flavobacterium sp. 140616W15]|uniref:hypothetical protein n=1 Tax=Flavobacterium sp. 140616W15 TaxID=2478552 RepID=UPI000F0BE8D8|nr:hypothetical protein [Flavobacterium sp. 140616W15]AYN04778.1 hypothetical protein EAG11_11850 [Flavobacterium sp. 140616W15]
MEVLEEILEKDDVRFIAVEATNPDNIIASGNNANEVIKKAEMSGIEFIFSYIPDKNQTFIF